MAVRRKTQIRGIRYRKGANLGWNRSKKGTDQRFLRGFYLGDWDAVSEVKVAQSCPTLQAHGILQAKILEWVALPFSRGSSQPRDWTQVSCIAGWFFTIWATRESKNIGVDSLSLLQWIFLTQELNWGLLHCRQILYQLSYQGHREPLTMNKAEKTEITGWLWGETIV